MELVALMRALLAAPGSGITAFSAGKGASLDLVRRYALAVDGALGDDEVARWDTAAAEVFWAELRERRLPLARVAVIGVPSDTGAGIRKGAAQGPRALRMEWLGQPELVGLLRSDQCLDLGDLRVNPHFLADEMLAGDQIERAQRAMYPGVAEAERAQIPVSPLSQLEFLLTALLATYPDLRVFVIGGDHSIAWPVSRVLAGRYPELGIVQPDAHTDLLPERLGVTICFGTWSFHAARLLGSPSRLVQVGVRQSGADRAHWESTTGVRQFWPDELHRLGERGAIDAIVAHLHAQGVRQLYLSNDIDGTDSSEVSATGTPAPGGLRSEWLLALIERLGAEFECVAGDVMELAPDLGPTPEHAHQTVRLTARYAVATIRAQLRR